MSELFIPVLAGTTREQRKSIFAARLVAEVGNTLEGVSSDVVDPMDFNFPGDGNDPEGKDARYTELTANADGFFIVTPEYNHSFPGSLKRMLDSELSNYVHKPVAYAGVSSGRWGGVRAIESLVSTARNMGLVSTFTDMQFPNIQDLFDEDGILQDEAYKEYVKSAWVELVWMTKVLKAGRSDLPSECHQ